MSLPAGALALLTSLTPAAFEIDRDLRTLSSDEMGGRDTGSPHVARAEALIAERFRSCGLQPLPGESGFRLPFRLEREGFDRACSAARVAGMPLVPEVDWRPFDFSGTGDVDAPLVFAGYGISSVQHAWDDYAALDVEGKAVLVLRHEPHETDPASPFQGTESTTHASFAEKVANAGKHGAAAILIVTDPLHHGEADDLRWGGTLRRAGQARPNGGGDDEPVIPAIQISRAVAELLVRRTGSTLAELQIATDERTLPPSLPALGRLELTLDRLADPEVVPATNVLGFLPGSDEAVNDEWIVVGAHHDHVGMFHGEGDTIFNGADDNASGTVAVLQLACRFAASPLRPRRSLLFVTFSAEEKGLHGSRHLVENVLPMERVAFMLNSDMLGRNPERPIEAVGDGYGAGLRGVIESAAEGLPLELQYAGDGYFGASDHEPFYERDVPFLFFFTGLHEDYHRVGDHHEKIDRGRLEALIALEERVVRALADGPERPRFVHHVPWLGAHAEVRDGRAVLAGVDAGGRGHAAGLRAGDVVVRVGDVRLRDPAAIGRAFRDVDSRETEIEVVREGSPRVIAVTRPKPGWLGVWPGDVDADVRRRLGLHPEDGLLVRTAVAEGPAAKAGVRDGDILVSLGGRVVSQRTLQARLAQFGAGETVAAVVIRDDERRELRITLGERPQR